MGQRLHVTCSDRQCGFTRTLDDEVWGLELEGTLEVLSPYHPSRDARQLTGMGLQYNHRLGRLRRLRLMICEGCGHALHTPKAELGGLFPKARCDACNGEDARLVRAGWAAFLVTVGSPLLVSLGLALLAFTTPDQAMVLGSCAAGMGLVAARGLARAVSRRVGLCPCCQTPGMKVSLEWMRPADAEGLAAAK